MSWILLSFIPPLLWSFSIILYDYLAKRRFSDNPTLMILMASFMELIGGAFLLLLYPGAWAIPVLDKSALMLLGVVIGIGFIPYVWALKDCDASLAVPIFQIVPVFIFILEWLFMDQTFTLTGVAIALFIMAAAIGLSWDFRSRNFHWRALGLMLLSSFILGVYSTFAKYYTDAYTPIYAYCWALLGAGIAAVIVYALHPPWFRQTRAILRGSSLRLTGIFAIQAVFDILAVGVFFLAIAKAPAAAYVQTLNGLQPLYVLLLSYGAGRVLSAHFDTHYIDAYFGWKLVCILALIAGVTALILHFRTGLL